MLPFLELVLELDKSVNACLDPSIHLRQYHVVKVGGRFLDLRYVTGPPIKHVVPIATEKPVISFRNQFSTSGFRFPPVLFVFLAPTGAQHMPHLYL